MDTKLFSSFDDGTYKRFSNPSLIEKDLQTLVGIISGIKSDAVINEKEQSEVINWINNQKEYENKQPYKEVECILFCNNLHKRQEEFFWKNCGW